jgi:putative transposase
LKGLVVQTYANCFVKRERPSRTLSADGPAPQPPASALRLRELPTDTSGEGEEC